MKEPFRTWWRRGVREAPEKFVPAIYDTTFKFYLSPMPNPMDRQWLAIREQLWAIREGLAEKVKP